MGELEGRDYFGADYFPGFYFAASLGCWVIGGVRWG